MIRNFFNPVFFFVLSTFIQPLPVIGQESFSFVVEPYQQFATKTGIYILWETNEASSSLVEYGPALFTAQEANLSLSHTSSVMTKMHEVKLEGLTPQTSYFWRVISVTKNGQKLTSPIYTFKTAPSEESAIMFALISDTQKNSETPWAWGKIAEKVWEERPDFVVHAGDLVDKGLQKEDWTNHFFPYGAALMQRVPVYSVLGNHEQNAGFYYTYTVAPEPEYYYTFSYGPVQFFMLDSNRDVDKGSEQYQWLEWELAKSSATWKIVVHHHPPYTSDSDDYGDTSIAASTLGSETRILCDLYDKYGVDFCFFGHTHLYERTWPIKNQKIDNEDGVVYINAGGAGGYIEKFAPTRSWFTTKLRAIHHFCTFAVYKDFIECKAIDYEGNLIDMFSMKKLRKISANTSPPPARIKAVSQIFTDTLHVRLSAMSDSLSIFYTLDGSEPAKDSYLYTKPIILSSDVNLRVSVINKAGEWSEITEKPFRKVKPISAVNPVNVGQGVRYSYYEGKWKALPDFNTLQPISQGVVQKTGLTEIKHRQDHFALVFEGFFEVKSTGRHAFYINSDDGSKLYIHDQLIINHDGQHSAISKTGECILSKGWHPFRIEYFEAAGSQVLEAGFISEDGKEKPWSAEDLNTLK
jgi:predicted phosphodiesterase